MDTGNGGAEAQYAAICRRHEGSEGPLLPVLHDVQAEFGHISEASVCAVAQYFNLSRAEVYGVVSFYHDFRRVPTGNSVIKVCRAEACQAVGGREVWDAAAAVVSEAEQSVELQSVYCLGNCPCAPAAQLDGRTLGRQTPELITRILKGVAERIS